VVSYGDYPHSYNGYGTNTFVADATIAATFTDAHLTSFPTANLRAKTLSATGLGTYGCTVGTAARVSKTFGTYNGTAGGCPVAVNYTLDAFSNPYNTALNLGAYHMLSFFVPFRMWSVLTIYMGHMMVDYLTQGVRVGRRVAAFSMHIDDVLLTSPGTSTSSPA